jgi:hypothetical protein
VQGLARFPESPGVVALQYDIIGALVRVTPPCCLVPQFQFPCTRHIKVNSFIQRINGVSSVIRSQYSPSGDADWSKLWRRLIILRRNASCSRDQSGNRASLTWNASNRWRQRNADIHLVRYRSIIHPGAANWYLLFYRVCFILRWPSDRSFDIYCFIAVCFILQKQKHGGTKKQRYRDQLYDITLKMRSYCYFVSIQDYVCPSSRISAATKQRTEHHSTVDSFLFLIREDSGSVLWLDIGYHDRFAWFPHSFKASSGTEQ